MPTGARIRDGLEVMAFFFAWYQNLDRHFLDRPSITVRRTLACFSPAVALCLRPLGVKLLNAAAQMGLWPRALPCFTRGREHKPISASSAQGCSPCLFSGGSRPILGKESAVYPAVVSLISGQSEWSIAVQVREAKSACPGAGGFAVYADASFALMTAAAGVERRC